uniref:receptor protein-tyrosine kinase n=1 Tax=Scleropages formosus TaxID=113540 RepID=A0A8C9RXC1_SCLFO
MIYLAVFVLCGFPGGALAKGQKSKARLSSPVLDVQARYLAMEANQTLHLNCKGRWELSWTFPKTVVKDLHSLTVVEHRCGKQDKLHCSSLRLSPALVKHTGSFSCTYQRNHKKQAAVYVYVTGRYQPFVEMHTEVPEVLYLKEGQALTFPCRVTTPDLQVSLVKFPGQRLIPDQKNIIWNSMRGFIVPNPTFQHIGLFSCEITVDGLLYSNKYLTHRQVNKILDVYLNSTEPLLALRGDRFALNCTVTAAWNSRVSITWRYPGQTDGSASISRRILEGQSSRVFYSILSIPQLRRSDHGLYVCRVTSGPSSRETNVSLTVYDQPFIRLKHRHGPLLEALAGQKAYKLSVKLRAFPTPQVIWLKDGAVAAERCSRYNVEGNSLVIRDVAPEDAGVYTVLVGIQQYRLYKNLTISLVVNMKPQIEEKAVSLQDSGIVRLGTSRALLCTSAGIPPAKIHWLWYPCPQKGPCEQTSSAKGTPVEVNANIASAENRILSISQRQEVIEGKNKTVGVLTVAEASVSGVYRCVASNHVGQDWRDSRFYITDTPGGFTIDLEEEPREGADLHLLCRASKHLYTALSWHRATPAVKSIYGTSSRRTAVPAAEVRAQLPSHESDLLSGPFSNTLRLLLRNLTAHSSGTYSCSAQHLLTGKEVHLDTSIEVIALEAPVLLQNLSDCTVNVSSSMTLACPARGVPRPQVTWYKDHVRMHQGSGILLSPDGGKLHIERITAEDEGLYTCKVTNEKGSVESSAHVWVDAHESSLEIATITCTCVVATLFWLLLTLFIRKLKQPTSSSVKTDYLSIVVDAGEGALDEQCERLPYDPGQWEFPRHRLKLEKPLGQGAFGKVMQASAFGINNSISCKTVAVKMLKDGATPSEHKALMTELKILIHIGHHLNVVNLLGACTKAGGPLLVIVEYCKYGNLSAYLKSKRDVFLLKRDLGEENGGKKRLTSVSSSQSTASSGFEEERDHCEDNEGSDSTWDSPLFLEDLISYSFQVARGMEFLASRKCVHRDLAARNVLLSESNVVKICDFGLAWDVYKDPDYVRKGDARLPLKWMSPESIFDKVFTTQSDVWSFGVLLWEIFSLGASPYPGIHVDEDFCHRLKEGTRMRAPDYSTPEIYHTMLFCWEADPAARPTFTELVETLGDLLQARVQQDGKDYIPLSPTPPTHPSTLAQLHPLQASKLKSHSPRCPTAPSAAGLSTFEELPDRDAEHSHDYQTDSGMVLPSEELQHVKWSERPLPLLGKTVYPTVFYTAYTQLTIPKPSPTYFKVSSSVCFTAKGQV